MTYGMTKEQLIAANGKLIKALQIKEAQIAELHDKGYCSEHDSWLGLEPHGCLVPYHAPEVESVLDAEQERLHAQEDE